MVFFVFEEFFYEFLLFTVRGYDSDIQFWLVLDVFVFFVITIIIVVSVKWFIADPLQLIFDQASYNPDQALSLHFIYIAISYFLLDSICTVYKAYLLHL